MPGSKSRESEARSEDSGAKVKIIDETSLTCTCDYQPLVPAPASNKGGQTVD